MPERTIPIIGSLFGRRKKHKALFSVIWKKSSSLKPKEVLGDLRPYNEYYYKRTEDDQIAECLKNKQNVMVIGPPLGGKTRSVYEALKNLEKPACVIIPRHNDIDLESFVFPLPLNVLSRPCIVFIDDFHTFVEKQNFDYLITTALKKNITIVCTCRSGFEFKKAKNSMLGKNLVVEMLFGDNIVELPDISSEKGQEIAVEVNREWNDIAFNGTVGSILMPLSEMKKRFEECESHERVILRALRNLYLSGAYKEDQAYPLEWIKIIAKTRDLEGKEYEWTGWLERLEGKEFIKREKDNIRAEETYIEKIVTPKVEISDLELFDEMITAFAGVPHALFKIGHRAYKIGQTSLDKADYMKTAINAYVEALKEWALENFPMDYAITRNNLGIAYRNLGDIEDKAINCKLAIKAYEEALKVYTLDRFPKDYAMTRNNLGVAYSVLGEVEDKAINCKLAIKAYEKALKVYTLERFPMDYATTQNNLGNAYGDLGEVEDKVGNCKLAIEAFGEALKVYTLNRLPMDYAMTQNNLGNVYGDLEEVENKAGNCKLAIEAYEEALKVYTLDRFPMQYATIQNNLGNAYRKLAEVLDKKVYVKKALDAYNEALKVFTMDRLPMQYAQTQNNLGNAYRILAEVLDKKVYGKKALDAYNEALKVYTKDKFPIQYEGVTGNLKKLKRFMEEG